MDSSVCTVCLDHDVKIGYYSCVGPNCTYQLCVSCIKLAFQDASGADSNSCPMCKTPMARNMMKALCGEGAIKAVEKDVRTKVEFDVEQEYMRRERGKEEMKKMTERAGELYLELSEELNMKCPRCQMTFYDYDGCNALVCGNADCEAHFCAVCLEDCGTDAHPHVGQRHGDLFDHAAFHRAR